ncbi:hypothetical protein P6U16_13425 [Rhizobium sp. 32-5/1]|uniref:hypothetical protein n=1 Tax=Rhizobium sp. 32-5/1 TaxID=3019602 RepID=UPI00240DD837|nr:hypothetical protein [Rhizobium sp. 32-5/1]WEZ82178.1 hypothetical protein P6U16_13425 [Rhizobium sp. 32-5/1]
MAWTPEQEAAIARARARSQAEKVGTEGETARQFNPEQQKALALARARMRRAAAETAISGQTTGVVQPDGKLHAKLFDGTILTFPANTPPEVISRVAKEQTLAKRDALNVATPNSDAPSTATDMLYSGASGVVRGAAELAMLPMTGKRMIESGLDYLVDKGEGLIRSAVGAEQRPIGRAAEARANMAKYDPTGTAINSGQDAIRGVMDDNLYAPKTTAGEYAETVGEFVAPGGFPTRAARAMPTLGRKISEGLFNVTRNAAVPGLASEAAGQMTEGTAYEPAARIAGAVMGNAGVAAARSASTPEAVIRRAVGDPEAIDWERAVQLQNNGRGVTLTGPEAITQATNGGTALPNLQRVVEGSADGRARTAPFFSARPGQVHNAVDEVLNLIAAQSDNPSLLGPRAVTAAEGVIDRARQRINATTRPLYDAAATQTIPDARFIEINSDPRFQTALARLRANPELAPDYAALPDNAIGVVDAVTKDMFSRGEALANRANPLYGPEAGARNTSGAANARDIARDPARGGSADYDAALQQQARMRRDILEPLQQGPVGRVASATDTAGAGNALLPLNPLTGSRDETIDAITRLIDQDPATTTGLIRQNLADRFHRAATETQEGANEFVGAKFHKDIAGNVPRRQTLDAAMSALPDQRAATTMPELLDVLQATGRRKPIGSATAFNSTLQSDLGTGSMLATPFRTGAKTISSFGTNIGNAMTQATQRNNMRQLADLFTEPNSVEMIRSAMNRRPGVAYREAFQRSAAQSGAVENE